MDDLNTPQAIAHLHELGTALANALPLADRKTGDELSFGLAVINENRRNLLRAAALLGLLQHDPEQWFIGSGSTEIDEKVAARTAAKAAKNWAEADRIRDELKAESIVLEDRPDGTTDWRRA